MPGRMTDDLIVGNIQLVMALWHALLADIVGPLRQLDPAHPHDFGIDHEPQHEVEVALKDRVPLESLANLRELVWVRQRHLDERRYFIESKQIAAQNDLASLY